MDFSFGVLTFNSSKYVLETLFSIKYQVQNYLQGEKVELVISDDASDDDTILIVKKWLDMYSYLFYSTNVIVANKNGGTVKNYHSLIDSLHSEKFHIIAGDDLFACNNVVSYFDKMKKGTCLSFMPLALKNGRVFLEEHRLIRFNSIQKNLTNKTRMTMEKYVMLGSYVHTPSTVFLKSQYVKKYRDYVSKFVLFEDDPRWFCFAKDKIIFDFILDPIVIYRYREDSVAHQKGLTKFDIDSITLNEDYLKGQISLKMRLYINSKIRTIKKQKKLTFCNIARQIDYYINKFILLKNNKRDKALELGTLLEKNRSYYMALQKEVVEFLKGNN